MRASIALALPEFLKSFQPSACFATAAILTSPKLTPES
jgi:hypothetical protein